MNNWTKGHGRLKWRKKLGHEQTEQIKGHEQLKRKKKQGHEQIEQDKNCDLSKTH